MWLVRLALRRPYTIAVSCLLIMILGVLSLTRMTVDIFPVIDIPVVVVVWIYPGLSAQDMERRVVLISERGYSTTVNGISRIESQSIPGIGLLRVYFQPGTDIGAAIAQISAVSSTILRIAPPGMTPPSIIQFNATNVPVAQLTISSKTLPEQQLYDYSLNFIRVRLFTIPGLSTPAPFGGKERQIIIDINPQALAAKGLSAGDVVNALQTSNVILPAGDARIGNTDYSVQLNSSPETVAAVQPHPDQGRRYGDCAARGRSESRRQLRRATRHCPCQRQARDLSRHPETFRRVHAGSGGSDARHVAHYQSRRAPGHGPEDRLRSVCLRARRDHGSGARSRALIDSGFADDSGVSRQLAERGGGLHFDPAGHLHRHHRPQSQRRYESTS